MIRISLICYYCIFLVWMTISVTVANNKIEDEEKYQSKQLPSTTMLSYNLSKLCSNFLQCHATKVFDLLPLDNYRYELLTDEKMNGPKYFLSKTVNNYWTIKVSDHVWFVVNTQKNSIDEHYQQALELAKSQHYGHCIELSNRAIQVNPAFDSAYFLKSYCCFQTGDIESFIENIEKAIRINPNNYEYLNQIAWFYATTRYEKYRDGEKALQYALIAASLDSGNWVIIDTLAAAYARNGQFNEAVAASEKALELLEKQSFESSDAKEKAISNIVSKIGQYKDNKTCDEN